MMPKPRIRSAFPIAALLLGLTRPSAAAPDCNTNGLPDDGEINPLGEYALHLDGTDDYVDCGTSSTLSLAHSFTLEAWVRPDSITGIQRIVSKGAPKGYGLGQVDGRLRFTTHGIQDYDTADAYLSVGVWNHVAVVFDASNDTHFYVNGLPVETVPGASDAKASSAPFNIGRMPTDVEYWNGDIDEVRVWNDIRTDAEILAAFQTRVEPTEQGLLAYWRLDESEGFVADDFAGSLDGLLFNGPTWIALPVDCGTNGVPDECEPDCNTNALADVCELELADCDTNGALDACEASAGSTLDCDGNATPDACDVAALDCNTDGLADPCTLSGEATTYASNPNTPIPDEGQILSAIWVSNAPAANDLNVRLVIEHPNMGALYAWLQPPAGEYVDVLLGSGAGQQNCDLLLDDHAASPVGYDTPMTGTYRPPFGSLNVLLAGADDGQWTLSCSDEFGDANSGVLHEWSLHFSFTNDCDTNHAPDECEIAGGSAPDCNTNGQPDHCELLLLSAPDCNTNSQPDSCDLMDGSASDCNQNAVPDGCDIDTGQERDCNSNWIPDVCEISAGYADDCNTNAFPDSCDLAGLSIHLTPAEQYPIYNVTGIAIADLDNDGDADFAGASFSGDGVALFLNDGAGAFTLSGYLDTSSEPWEVSAADLDLDGDQDLITVAPYDNIVSVLINNGAAAFSVPVDYPVGSEPYAVIAEDFDGDGDADLAVPEYGGTPPAVSVLRNNGDATFAAAVAISLPNTPTALASGDFDGDGDFDLAVAQSNLVSVLFNDGDASFVSAADYSIDGPSSWIVAEDLDADGDVDLTAVGGDRVSQLDNTGAGMFTLTYTTYLGSEIQALAASDIDRDGDMDLALPLNVAPERIEILRNIGGGDAFADTSAFIGGSAYHMTPGDLDGDGDDDFLILRYEDDGEVVIVRNDSTMRLHDCNLNFVLDDCDIAAGEAEDCNTNLIPDECDAAPVIEFEQAAYSRDSYVNEMINVDLDGDLDRDLVMADNYQAVAVAINNGNGVFGKPVLYDFGGNNPADFASGDFDGDNDHDLVVAVYGSSPFLMLNNGLGAFSAPVEIPSAPAYTVIAAHLNGDDHLDLAFMTSDPARIGVCLNDGAGGFTAPDYYTIEDLEYAGRLAAGDLDSDGDLDLASANSDEPGLVHVFLNSGSGAFSLAASLPVGDDPYRIVMADLDGDADVDIATSNYDIVESVSVLPNAGDATFAPAVHYALEYDINILLASDLGLDGRPDLVLSTYEDREFVVMLNYGDGTLRPPQRIAASGRVSAMTADDFNGDGAPDIVAAIDDYPDYRLSVFLHDGVEIHDADSDGVPDECQNLPGDMNCDGAIDAADLPLFVQALLAVDEFTGCDIGRADLNDDGVADGDDVQLFLNALWQP